MPIKLYNQSVYLHSKIMTENYQQSKYVNSCVLHLELGKLDGADGAIVQLSMIFHNNAKSLPVSGHLNYALSWLPFSIIKFREFVIV